MKGYRLRWQTIVGAVLLFLLWMTIFLPGLSISADKYVDSAISAGSQALGKDGADTGEGTIKRSGLIKDYEKKIQKTTDGDTTVSRLFLAKWLLRVDQNLDLEWIQLKDGRVLGYSDVISVFRLWGWLIYIPFLIVTVTIVFMLSRGQTLSGVLLFNGLVTILCECLGRFLIPSMLWSSGKSVICSFDLIDEDLLSQYGTGELFLKELLHRCGGMSWVIVLLFAFVIVVYSIFCLVLWTKEHSKTGKDIADSSSLLHGTGVWEGGKPAGAGAVRTAGKLQGIKGEYAGQSIEISAGEEIVLGRDPKYCMLIFSNPKVSRRHCGIRFDAVKGSYQAIDYSSGGTTLSNGILLAASEYTELSSGVMIHMAGNTEIFMMM